MAALVVIVLGVSAGFAIAQEGGGGEPRIITSSVPASECPEANAAFARIGREYDGYVPDCPSPETIAEVLDEIAENSAIARSSGLERR